MHQARPWPLSMIVTVWDHANDQKLAKDEPAITVALFPMATIGFSLGFQKC
jgi:hypothetical protein